jgi:uncharacterized repeat protein (TIGR01451 family)
MKKILFVCLMMLMPLAGNAALLSRTITINGAMGDWTAAPDITNNPGQFSTDCEEGEPCERDAVGSTGRDLKKFTFTWDDDYLYFYVERYASTSNTTDWLFYLDENANGRMESNERIFRVQWQGSNRSTNAYLCPYYPVDTTNGDPITDGNGFADGYTMPGGSSNSQCAGLYSNVTGGSTTGLEMESRLSWAQLGLAGPQNIRFHISSSTGVNLPSQVVDNMDGPGGNGGQFFPPDMAMAISASAAQVSKDQTVTFSVTLTNVLYDSFSDIVASIPLPPQLEYVSHSAPVGTSFVDSDADGAPDEWLVTLLEEQETLTLEITAVALSVPFAINTTTTAALVSWTGNDTDPGNNSASVQVQVLPTPELSVVKIASTASADPGSTISYTATVSNSSTVAAHNVVVTHQLDAFLSLRLDTFGPGNHVQFNDGSPASGLTLGAVDYSQDNGATWSYTPVSGGGGAAPGYDSAVTHIRATMAGNMTTATSFSLLYDARLN